MSEEKENTQNPEAPDEKTTEQTTDNLSTEEAETATEETPTELENEESDTEEPTGDKTEEKAEKHSFFNRKSKKEEELKKRVEELEKQKKELNEKFLHLYSEFDNYKKRTNREKLELLDTASEKVIVSLLPIIDDFERAIKANEKTEELQVIKDGFTLIYNKMLQLLKRFDVEEIPAKGETFNTDFHEAVTHFPAPTEEEKGKVIDVTEKGYKIKEKVIRYSKVVVGQ